MPKRKYTPGTKKITAQKKIITETEYWKLINQGKRIPAGAEVKPRKVGETTLGKLKIRFHADGSIEIPKYTGKEGKLKKSTLKTKTIPEGVRLIYHQIESVETRIGQAKEISNTVSRMHYDLEHQWKKFNPAQKKSYTKYLIELIGKLTKNPLLLKEENKIRAVQRFNNAKQLLEKGNSPAASAVLRGIENDMQNWLRKMKLQSTRLERRKNLVVDKKFQKDERIFSALDSMINVFNQLRQGIKPKEKQRIAKTLYSIKRKLFATGLSKFKSAGIIIEKAAKLVKKGEITKARSYIKNANKKTVAAASEISSIYPDKLMRIGKSTDLKFKTTVLANQTLLFHDMMSLWWIPKNKTKTKLILETITELSSLAESTGKKEVSRIILNAKIQLTENKIQTFTKLFEKALNKLEQKKT